MVINARKIHLISIILLIILLPTIFFVGVILRPQPLVVSDRNLEGLIPQAELVFSPETNDDELYVSNLSSNNNDLQLRLRKIIRNNEVFIDLKLRSDLHIGDPLVYWEKEIDIATEITEKSILLGQLHSHSEFSYRLTEEMKSNSGIIIIYSPISRKIEAIFAVKI